MLYDTNSAITWANFAVRFVAKWWSKDTNCSNFEWGFQEYKSSRMMFDIMESIEKSIISLLVTVYIPFNYISIQ